jgi:ornithine cyclodeaminase/alanine dehydrogenase-like protein (mu-crystallin family)
VPLYVREAEVEQLLWPEDAVKEIEACFIRMSHGQVAIQPRVRLGLEDGSLHVLAAADLELGVAAFKAYVGFQAGARFVVGLFAHDRPELFALVEAGKLGQLRTGAASAVAARHLARSGATSLGVIGTGRQAESQVACILAALPGIKRVVAYSRSAQGLAHFCERFGAEMADSGRDAAEQDIVVTITTSSDPVLHGNWLRPGTLVCAAGANRIDARELDDDVLARAAFVCCDFVAQGAAGSRRPR